MLEIPGQVVFVYLKASLPLIQERLKRRVGHFMNPNLIQSQFNALEEPGTVLQIDAGSAPAAILEVIRNKLAI
jgi:gluconokinase